MAYPGSATYRATTQPEILPQSTYRSLTNPEIIPGPDNASPLPRGIEHASTDNASAAAR